MTANRAHLDDSAESNTTPSTCCRTGPTRSAAKTIAGGGGDSNDVDGIDCSRACCESCVAGAVADAVAICCCPCAVVDLAAFVLLQVPWAVARRCLAVARGKKRRKRIAECGGGAGNGGEPRRSSGGISRNYSERWKVNEGISDVTTSFSHGDDEEENAEADERVWLELSRGFGRLSFTGIQSAGKGN